MGTKRLKMPSENVEYIFRFPPHRKITYRWFGDEKGKGRLVFYNVTGKYYTAMTVFYFNYLLSNRLVEKTNVEPLPEIPERKEKTKQTQQATLKIKPKEEPKEEPKKDLDKIEPLSTEEKTYLNNLWLKINALNSNTIAFIERQLGKNAVSKLGADIKNAILYGISDNDFQLVIRRSIQIDELIRGLIKINKK